MEENTQKNSAVWYTVGAIIIVIAAYLLFFKSPTETIAPTDGSATTTNAVATSSQEITLEVNDQFSTSTVTVDKVVTSAPAWLVVHRDVNSKPAGIVRAAWVPAGEQVKFVIDLDPALLLTEGQTYYVMVHADDGTAGFNYKTDLPLTDATGNQIMKSFKVIFGKN